jgi:hypothetical protein
VVSLTTLLLCFTLQWMVWHRSFLTQPTASSLSHGMATTATGTTGTQRDYININSNDTSHTNHKNSNRVVHQGQFGLGHRLSKLSAAYHLAERLSVPILEAQWNDCRTNNNHNKNSTNSSLSSVSSEEDNTNNMFHRLFGGIEIPIQSRNNRRNGSAAFATTQQQRQGKTILVRNDVHGYYAGQAYKNFQIPIDDSVRQRWKDKLDRDRRLFRLLQDRFMAHHPQLREFQQQHDWLNHHVIGVHIRAGNGEAGHFAEAQRGTQVLHHHTTNNNNNTTMMDIPRVLVQFIQDMMRQHQHKEQTSNNDPVKPILVFVATDTVAWIDILQHALSSSSSSFSNIPVISFPQSRVEPGQGVGFSAWKDDSDHCVDGWITAAMDMFLLAATNTLIATTRSTFTQILPLRLVLSSSPSGTGGTFCEVHNNLNGSTTTSLVACFRSMDQWLFPDQADNTTDHTNPHKVMVHLPDVHNADRIFENAQQFLDGTAPLRSDEEHVYYYGRKYNPNYRAKRPFQSSWAYQS